METEEQKELLRDLTVRVEKVENKIESGNQKTHDLLEAVHRRLDQIAARRHG